MDDPPGLTPEARERPPAAPERREYRRHRPSHALPIVLGILLGAAAIAIAVVVLRSSGDDSAAATTSADTPVPALPTLKIVFPEGFTREEMARRIGAVNGIAKEAARPRDGARAEGVPRGDAALADPGRVRRGEKAPAARRASSSRRPTSSRRRRPPASSSSSSSPPSAGPGRRSTSRARRSAT